MYARLRTFVVAVAFIASGAAHAAEGPRTSSLGWVRLSGAESCIGPGALAKAVEARLRRAIFVSAARADVTVEGRIEKTPKGFRAVIAMSDAAGKLLGNREVARDGDACSEIDEELAFVIAVLLDPEAALAPPPPPPPAPAPIIVREQVLVPVPGPAAEPPAEPIRWHVGAGPMMGVGALPGVAAGVTVRAGVIPARFPAIELYSALWEKRRAEGAEGRGASELSLAYGGLLVCPLGGRTGPVRAFACLGGELGSLTARGVDLDVSHQDESLFASAVLAGRAHVRVIGPLGISTGLSLAVPLKRNAFYYADPAGNRVDLFRAAPIAAAADVGLVLVYPP